MYTCNVHWRFTFPEVVLAMCKYDLMHDCVCMFEIVERINIFEHVRIQIGRTIYSSMCTSKWTCSCSVPMCYFVHSRQR